MSTKDLLIEIGTDIAGSAYNPDGRESKELLDEAERRVFTIAEQGTRSENGFKDIKHLLSKTVEQIDYLFEQDRSEEHTSELQSLRHIVCRLLLEKQ